MKIGRVLPFLSIVASLTATAQTFDNSGNGQLNGTYYFRQVAYVTDGQGYGDLKNATVVYGNIVFNGSGGYTLQNVTYGDIASGQLQSYTHSGTYSISASGLGYISSPNPNFAGDSVYGLVSNGIFISSSTSNASGYNDLLIAAPAPSSNQAATSAFTGSYSLAYMNFISYGLNLDKAPTQIFDAQMTLNPSGGSLGTVNLNAYFLGTNGPGTQMYSEPGVKYIVSGGAVVATFPITSGLPITGQQYIYVSPDGNFVFGGAPNGVDMFVGVRTTSGTPNFNGLYYQAGLEEDEFQVLSPGDGATNPEGYYGSLYAGVGPTNTGILNHQRLLAPTLGTTPVDDTFSETINLNSDGSYDDSFGIHYVFGLNGGIAIGLGHGSRSLYGLSVLLQAPAAPPVSINSVYLSPTGIQNAASSALFTAGIAPGEYINLFGSGLASAVARSSAFPTTLGNVQVLINFRQAPLYYVSPTEIIAVVPYSTTGPVVQIQVINNDVRSNAVTAFSSSTSPGIFTVHPGGLGEAAAQHSDFTLITSSKPAQPGENIILYLTGLGLVSPLPAVDGNPAGSNPTSNTVQPLTVYIGNQPATILFSGLTPSLVNVYQLNVTVPAGVSAGEQPVEIDGPDSAFFLETTIPVAGATAAARAPVQVTRVHHPAMPARNRVQPKADLYPARPITSQ